MKTEPYVHRISHKKYIHYVIHLNLPQQVSWQPSLTATLAKNPIWISLKLLDLVQLKGIGSL